MPVQSFSWGDGTTDKIYVTTNVASGNDTVLVSSDANNTGSIRVKVLTFSTGVASVSRQLTVTQDKQSVLQYYYIDLNNEWVLDKSIYNPNTSLYSGVYKSFSNYHVANSTAEMTITLNGYTTFELYIRSWAESTYDYTMASTLDGAAPTSSSSSTCYAHTKNSNNTSGNNLSDYKKVTYNNITTGGRDHTIHIVYMKDQATNSNDDRGYLLIPWYDNTKVSLTFSNSETPDATGSPEQYVYEYRQNDEIQLPGQIFQAGTYHITGWNDGNMLWLPNADYTVSVDTTFMAHWAAPTATELTSFSSMSTGDSITVLLMNTNGSYYIASSSNSTTVTRNTNQATAIGDTAYYWTLTKVSSTTFKLQNSAGYYLYSSSNSRLAFNATNSTAWTTSYSSTNKWYFRRTSSSSYYLRLNGTTLQSSNSSTGRYWRIFQVTYQ